MTIALLVIAGLFLPLYPLNAGANVLLQGPANGAWSHLADGPPWWREAGFMALILVLFPLLGSGLVLLAMGLGEPRPGVLGVFGVWGGLTSLLYAFRLLSAQDGAIWLSHLFSSALALVWVGIACGLDPLLPALALSVSLLPLLFLLAQLQRRFGIARSGLYPGLCCPMPRFSGGFVLAVLAAIAVPFSPAFFAIAAIAIAGIGADAAVALVPVMLSWLLWTWAGVNLFDGILWGTPRDDLTYRDLDLSPAFGTIAGLVVLAGLGVLFLELAL